MQQRTCFRMIEAIFVHYSPSAPLMQVVSHTKPSKHLFPLQCPVFRMDHWHNRILLTTYIVVYSNHSMSSVALHVVVLVVVDLYCRNMFVWFVGVDLKCCCCHLPLGCSTKRLPWLMIAGFISQWERILVRIAQCPSDVRLGHCGTLLVSWV